MRRRQGSPTWWPDPDPSARTSPTPSSPRSPGTPSRCTSRTPGPRRTLAHAAPWPTPHPDRRRTPGRRPTPDPRQTRWTVVDRRGPLHSAPPRGGAAGPDPCRERWSPSTRRPRPWCARARVSRRAAVPAVAPVRPCAVPRRFPPGRTACRSRAADGLEWLTSGAMGLKVARSGVKGRGPNSRVPGTAGSVVGARSSGTVLRQTRALARRQGKGDPAGQVPSPLRARWLPGTRAGRLPVPVDAGPVRTADGRDDGAFRHEPQRPQPGATVGVDLPRTGDRQAGTDGDSGPTAGVRRH